MGILVGVFGLVQHIALVRQAVRLHILRLREHMRDDMRVDEELRLRRPTKYVRIRISQRRIY